MIMRVPKKKPYLYSARDTNPVKVTGLSDRSQEGYLWMEEGGWKIGDTERPLGSYVYPYFDAAARQAYMRDWAYCRTFDIGDPGGSFEIRVKPQPEHGHGLVISIKTASWWAVARCIR
jgi:hypothetical protein